MNNIAKRIRSEQIIIRLTPAERAQFESKRNLTGLTMHAFLMECMRKKKMVIKPGADLLILQIKRVGNNLNQIAHRVNAGQITDCRAELRAIRDELEKIRVEWQS